jgi:hypothetical protein
MLVISFVGAPAMVVAYQSYRTGMTWSQVLERMFSGGGDASGRIPSTELPPGDKIEFLVPEPIGAPFTELPKIANLHVVDLDADGLLDVLVADCEANQVTWIRQESPDVFVERVLTNDLVAPAHLQTTDIDGDGDLDVLVAVLGMLFPNNDRIGSVVILENDGSQRFTHHVIIERIARVSDVRAADLDGDGDQDLAVAQFGYDDGETRWMENLGNWKFDSHMLQTLSGPIHCEIADLDGDGHLDIMVLVSQEWEEIYVFAGDGRGHFTPRRVFGSDNSDFGSSGMWLFDLDLDGDLDVLFTNGDAFDYMPPHPWPWHGVQWLENQGDFAFAYHRIADFGGAVNARPTDVDQDGDLDLFVASAFNTWGKPESQSLIWLENDGRMRFRRHNVTNVPTHIQCLELGDFDGDGRTDLVTGGMHVYEPFDRVERVVLWRNRWNEERPNAGG